MEIQKIKFPKEITCKQITLKIIDVYKSSKYDDAGISEIYFYYKGSEIPIYAEIKPTY